MGIETENIPDGLTFHKKKSKPNFLSRIFIWWVCPVIVTGNKRDVEENDLVVPGTTYSSKRQGDMFEQAWLDELERALIENREPSLWKALVRTYWLQYMPGAIYIAIITAARIAQPILFATFLTYWTINTTLSQYDAALYAFAILGLNFLAMMCQHHNSLFVMRFSMKVKIASSALLYRKLLRLNQVSVGDIAGGKLVNLLSNDIARFEYAFMFMHYIWIVPIQAAIVLYFLYDAGGFAPFVGLFGVILLILPIQAVLTKATASVRRQVATRTDKRIKLMSEIINGIQVIKMYAWEKPFQFIVKAARAYEIKALRKSIFIRSVFLGLMIYTERTVMFVTILTLILWNQEMVSATTVYPIAQFLSTIQINITMILPLAIASLSEMFVSVDRIQSFLVMDERDDLALTKNSKAPPHRVKFNSKQNGTPQDITGKNFSRVDSVETNVVGVKQKPSEFAIEISGVSASWSSNVATLKNLTFRIRPGKLCAVIGPVGSGKTSLLQLILKELPAHTGTLSINGSLSYSCQESWLFPATVRENILFGLPYEPEKYKEVCHACCLAPDFKQFPYSDLSLVGERGVSLSGGQRARINLARAVYRDVDIYLLDDPLSAVDANVGRLLLDNCIRGRLRGRTCLLVTHQIHYLKDADYIIVLNEGGIENMGTYDELAKSGKDFSLLLKELQDDTDDDKAEKVSSRPDMQRGMSVRSEDNPDAEKEQMVEAEERAKGNLKWSVIVTYLRSVQSWSILLLSLGTLMITQAAATFSDYWLSAWTNAVDQYIQTLPPGEEPDPGLNTDIGGLTTAQYLMIFGSAILAVILFSQIRIVAFVTSCVRASQNIHDKVFQNLINAIKRFFDTSSSGRILNRFSKDLGAVDELLPRSMLETLQMYLSMISVLALNATALPWTLIPTVVLAVIFVFLLKWYLQAAQAVKRLEGTTKSPVFGMINSTVSGLSTIRSSSSQHRLLTKFDQAQNLNTSAAITFFGGSAAFGMYIDGICILYLGSIMAIFIFIDFGEAAQVGSVGLAVNQSMVLTMLLQMAARFTADFLGQMTAVERTLEYTKLPSEKYMEEGTTQPPKQWPSSGHVLFENVFMKYGPEDPYVLNNLNISIKDGWKVGVVGRTGAGKSSLITALFRLSDIEGSIKIDGIDTYGIAKKTLRSMISIIPQEPVLFSATIRYNLDPFNNYSDDELWQALEKVELKDSVPALDFKISEGGSNFSMGQRQLICLARAILRSNRILIMDEATANVDPQTDALIQKTIRQQFAQCTVITIAHRLLTVMDADRVLVMDYGKAVEFDHPYVLLSDPKSHLNFLVRETSDSMNRALYDMAKTKYYEEHPPNDTLLNR